MIIANAVLLAVSLLLSRRVVRRLSAPVEQLNRLMQRMAANMTLSERADIRGEDEIASLVAPSTSAEHHDEWDLHGLMSAARGMLPIDPLLLSEGREWNFDCPEIRHGS